MFSRRSKGQVLAGAAMIVLVLFVFFPAGSEPAGIVIERAAAGFREVVGPERVESGGTGSGAGGGIRPAGGKILAEAKPRVAGLIPTILFLRQSEYLWQVVKVLLENPSSAGGIGTMVISRPDGRKWESRVKFSPGRNEILALVPDLRQPGRLSVSLALPDGSSQLYDFTWSPARQWTVYVTQLSHFDWGYTATQEDVRKIRNRILDQVIEFSRRTADWPEESKFRWTEDGSYVIMNYLQDHPDRVSDLEKLIRSDRLEINAKLAHLCSSTAGYEMLARELYYTKRELEPQFKTGFPTAIHTDVPGLTWGDATILAGGGVKYLLFHPNRFARGGDVLRVLAFPRAYYWQGPDGSRLLTWRAKDGYSEARFLIQGLDRTASMLPRFLAGLEKEGYPYDIVHLTRTGLDPRTKSEDNSPPRFEICETIRAWNQCFAFPRLVTTLPRLFFAELERKYRGQIPVYPGDKPDWWADGVLTDAIETGISRDLHHRLYELELWASAAAWLYPGFKYPAAEINRAYLDNYFFDEHTWGGAFPLFPREEIVWRKKRGDLLSAAAAVHRLRLESLSALMAAGDGEGGRMVLFNALGWPRSGEVKVYVRREDAEGRGRLHFALRDVANGVVYAGEVESEKEKNQDSLNSAQLPAFFYLEDIPAYGWRTYEWVKIPSAQSSASGFIITADSLENSFFKLRFDAERGGLISLYDKRLNRELVDPKSAYALGRIIRRRQGFVNEMDLKTPAHCTGVHFAARALSAEAAVGYFIPSSPLTRMTTIFTIYRDHPWVDVAVELKNYFSGPGESTYVSFPLTVSDPELWLEAPFSVMRPGLDQLPGFAIYYALAHWVQLRSKTAGYGITWSSREAPIVEFGGMRKKASFMHARFVSDHLYDGFPPRPPIYSEILHNFENTNYHIFQSGTHTWHYRISTFSGEVSVDQAGRPGWELACPLTGHQPRGGEKTALPPAGSFLEISPSSVLLITLKRAEDGQGYIIRLYESAGSAVTATIRFPFFHLASASLTDITEHDLADLKVKENTIEVSMPPFSVKTLRVR